MLHLFCKVNPQARTYFNERPPSILARGRCFSKENAREWINILKVLKPTGPGQVDPKGDARDWINILKVLKATGPGQVDPKGDARDWIYILKDYWPGTDEPERGRPVQDQGGIKAGPQ